MNVGKNVGEWYKKDHNMPEYGSFNGVLLFDNSIVWPLSLPACKCAVDGGAKPLHWLVVVVGHAGPIHRSSVLGEA